MMFFLNFTLNSVTMLALVLMVGIVIDDAIVVLENIFRFVEEKKMRPFEAARAATADIGLAVMATTLSLVVIFVPVSFMSSISGRFLYQFGLTAAASVMVSLLVMFDIARGGMPWAPSDEAMRRGPVGARRPPAVHSVVPRWAATFRPRPNRGHASVRWPPYNERARGRSRLPRAAPRGGPMA